MRGVPIVVESAVTYRVDLSELRRLWRALFASDQDLLQRAADKFGVEVVVRDGDGRIVSYARPKGS